MNRIQSIVLVVVMGLLVGLSQAYLFLKLTTLQARLERSPPIVVIDVANLIASSPSPTSQAELDQHMAKARQAFLALQQAGYLILDANAVLGAPADLYLSTEVMSP